jgi:phospholipid-transporting ATPase
MRCSISCSFLYRFFVLFGILLGNSSCCLTFITIWLLIYSRICSYRRTYIPASYHIAQELQKYNIPDYRPRQEQYVTVINQRRFHLFRWLGFRKLSRKSVLYNGCGVIVGLLSVRLKIPGDKIKLD